MRKLFLLIALVVGMTTLRAQQNPQPKWMSHTAGQELRLYTNERYFGCAMITTGLICQGFSILAIDKYGKDESKFYLASAGFGLVGGVALMISNRHINRAGILMDQHVTMQFGYKRIGLSFSI